MESPSRYGGMAAAMVFGVGLLLVGKTESGVAVLGIATLTMVFTLPFSARAKAFFVTILAAIFCGMFGYHAINNEITGTATYRTFARHDRGEAVTKSAQPEKFRFSTNLLWGGGLVCLLVSAGSFQFFRQLDDGEG